MSTLSDVFQNYQKSLNDSRSKYETLYEERAENAKNFYNDFFNNLIKSYNFQNPVSFCSLKKEICEFFGSEQIDFVAIDGTCSKDALNDFIVFFGGAYGSNGRISLQGDSAKVSYHKWEFTRDVSMVAYVPVPFAQITDVSDSLETFTVSDSDKIDLSSIHTHIMQLAEIFLAYNVVSSSKEDCPKLVMMDTSMSSVMASVSDEPDNVHMAGCYEYNGRKITTTDIAIAYAFPINEELGIPTKKKFKNYSLFIAEFMKNDSNHINLDNFAKTMGLSDADVQRAINYLMKYKIAEKDGKNIVPKIKINESWDYTKNFFQNLCERLFIKKETSVLLYDSLDENGVTRKRWMSPNDVKFLISVGIRALIEKCWKKKVLLIGVIKDSSSKYLTRNYLGVAKHMNLYTKLTNLDVKPLPWTDRIFLETLPLIDDSLNTPWSTIEIDSAFMTLFLAEDPKTSNKYISGVMGSIVSNEKLFARSLAQFFINREKKMPLMGHVIFIDRLFHPYLDKDKMSLQIKNDTIGEVNLFVSKDNNEDNLGQDMMMFFLNVLTRNHFHEVIGYPDPLHEADWGAKTIGKKVRSMIKSSEISMRVNPLFKKFRDIRNSARRI